MGAHGVMIEVHANPAVARSDADQQLSLPQFAELMRDVHEWVPQAPAPGRGASKTTQKTCHVEVRSS